MNNYLYILSVTSTIDEWNEKLNNFFSTGNNNVVFGATIIVVMLVIAIWGINTLNKK